MGQLEDKVIKSKLPADVKADFLEYITGDKAVSKMRKLLMDYLPVQEALDEAAQYRDLHRWMTAFAERLGLTDGEYNNRQIDLAVALVLYEQSLREPVYEDLFIRFTETYQKEGRVF